MKYFEFCVENIEMMYEVIPCGMDFMVRFHVTFATGFMQSWGGCLLESVVDENDFCFVCLIGKIHSVAREMVILLCF